MKHLILTFLAITFFALPAMANDDKSQKWSKSELEQLIFSYLMDNPDVLLDSVDAYAKEQADRANQEASVLLRENSDDLFHSGRFPETGNPKGDVTVIEFLDYNCGYCKKAMNEVLTLLGRDKNIRLLLVDIPILGEASTEAARWALAAKKQDRYTDYHIALMQHSGRVTPTVLLSIADKIGLDTKKLQKDKDDPAIDEELTKNIELAQKLGIRGTPAFVIGDELIRGYIGVDAMEQHVQTFRDKK